MRYPAPLFMVPLMIATAGACAADQKPLRVFVLAGQSNMEGKAAASTLEAVIKDPATHERFKHLMPEGRWAVRRDVWVTYLDRPQSPVSPRFGPLTVGFGSPKTVRDENNRRQEAPGIGPELGIGWVLGDHFVEPVLLVKAAWGGRSVRHTFRPPGAMPTEDELAARLAQVRSKKPDATLDEVRQSYGSDYRKIVEQVNLVLGDLKKYAPDYDESDGYQIAGFVWFQGWNDAIGEGNPDYVPQMAAFIRDMRRDLKTPDMPFVIGELGTDGPEATGWVAAFRKQQAQIAALPEFQGNVRLAKTAAYWPNPPDLSRQWAEFRAEAKANEQKPKDDPTRIDPGEYYQRNWVVRYKDELAFTSDKRYHYLGSGRAYYEMGESMGRAMLALIARP